MCGIVALISISDKLVLEMLLDGLKQLQNRGYDSAGICNLTNNFNLIKYASTNDYDSIKKLSDNIHKIPKSFSGIAHTRWATHGAKTDFNSHPHLSYDGNISIVHNGIIENFQELKDELISKNIQFKSQTDTEVIANLLAYNYSKSDNFVSALKKTLSMMHGTWGLAILNKKEPNKLYCVRHGSPLLVSVNKDMIMIASEQSGFCGLVNNYFVLDSNDICIIEKSDTQLNIKTNNKYKNIEANKTNFDLTPAPYKHWTIKEIYEQYDASLRAISMGGRLLNNNDVRLGGLEENKEILKRIDNIILLGCGTSYNAGLIGVNYFKDLCNFNTVQIFDGAEFTEKDIPKIGNTALILISQSGETADLINCINIAKKKDLFIIGVVNVVDSLIAREAHCGCYLNAGREVGVASTKSFTNQVIIISMIAIWFSSLSNINSNKRRAYIKYLRKLPYDLKTTIEYCDKKVKKYIPLLNRKSIFILGKGNAEAIAREGSLKIKELTYIHAEGYNGSALKHGPFALLDENVPVILIAPDNEYYDKMINSYQEVKSRKSPIILITDKESSHDNTLLLPKNKIYSDLLSVVPLQLFSYYISIFKGLDVDKPRNLAKCVTVL